MNEKPAHGSELSLAVVLCSVLAFSGLSAPAHAAELVLASDPYPYVVVDQEIKVVLVEFGRNVKLPVEVSDQIKGRMRGQHSHGSAQDFLDGLCDSYGLTWYFDGSVIHVSAKSEDRTEVVDMGAVPMMQAIDRLRSLDVSDHRFALKRTDDGLVSISGPPAYRYLAKQTLNALAHRQPEADVITVIRGGVSEPVVGAPPRNTNKSKG